MNYLRTDDSRFDNLEGFSFTPHYLMLDDQEGGELRLHYLDEGPKDAAPILLMHGEPSWCYLYRNLIPLLVAAGHRVIAPDLIGFGRSDKPTEQKDYTYQRHVNWIESAIVKLDLNGITLVCQDWGGLIGLRLVANQADRFDRVVAANTMLPTGHLAPGKAFNDWKEYSQKVPSFPAGNIIDKGTVTRLSEQVIAGYDAPFPDERYKAGARKFPLLVPVDSTTDDARANQQAWQILSEFNKPFLTAFSDSDPITKGGEQYFQKMIPGAQGQKHTTIEQGGHFLQEDQPDVLAQTVLHFINDNPPNDK